MVVPIVLYGSPILRQKAKPADLGDPHLPQLITNLWDTMRAADGVGLAAPQIGVSLQVFVVDAEPLQTPGEAPFQGVFINPEILAYGPEEVPHEEGCLSLPGIRETIYRPFWVQLRYWDLRGGPYEHTYEGIVARIIQHEYDHLQGKLFIDYLSSLKRQLLRGRLRRLQAGQIETFYPTRHAH